MTMYCDESKTLKSKEIVLLLKLKKKKKVWVSLQFWAGVCLCIPNIQIWCLREKVHFEFACLHDEQT